MGCNLYFDDGPMTDTLMTILYDEVLCLLWCIIAWLFINCLYSYSL
jgi:hypothetical protein